MMTASRPGVSLITAAAAGLVLLIAGAAGFGLLLCSETFSFLVGRMLQRTLAVACRLARRQPPPAAAGWRPGFREGGSDARLVT